AGALLAEADGHGGRMAFRWVALLSLVLAPVFGVMWWRSRNEEHGPGEAIVERAQATAHATAE
ncbi:MAG: hypothetical protein AAFQ53_09910, partial [Bacteroidota bacterium]